jgi:hypothetical protein
MAVLFALERTFQSSRSAPRCLCINSIAQVDGCEASDAEKDDNVVEYSALVLDAVWPWSAAR